MVRCVCSPVLSLSEYLHKHPEAIQTATAVLTTMCVYKLVQVGLKKEIFSDVNELWKIISTPGHLEKIHPYCKSNYTIKWSGKNSIDILIYLNGMRYVREFKSWNPKKGFSLVIGEENKEKSYVEWEISNANNKTYLAITVYPYFMKNYNKLISLLP